jgi:hypothetical protein
MRSEARSRREDFFFRIGFAVGTVDCHYRVRDELQVEAAFASAKSLSEAADGLPKSQVQALFFGKETGIKQDTCQ